MSRGHSASRRRNYGPRQRDVRRRPPPPAEWDAQPSEWPRGSAWRDEASGPSGPRSRSDHEEAA